MEHYALPARTSWPTGSATEYGASSRLLRRLWFAEEYLDDERRGIAWESLYQKAATLSLSDSEQTLLDIAFQMWTGHGYIMAALRLLDAENLEAFFEALEIRAGRREPTRA